MIYVYYYSLLSYVRGSPGREASVSSSLAWSLIAYFGGGDGIGIGTIEWQLTVEQKHVAVYGNF